MSRHTPWTLDQYGNVVDTTGTIVQVCGVSMPCGHVPRDHAGWANGRLLCAAPDLLAALREAEQFIATSYERTEIETDESYFLLQNVRAAISKAEGESRKMGAEE